jgi:hypothetical protein
LVAQFLRAASRFGPACHFIAKPDHSPGTEWHEKPGTARAFLVSVDWQ